MYTTFIKHCNGKFYCNNYYCAQYYCTQDRKEIRKKSVMCMRRAVGHECCCFYFYVAAFTVHF